MSDISVIEALKMGVKAHQSGNYAEADRCYTAILQSFPEHADANHNMGVLVIGLGKIRGALPFLKRALESNPAVEQYWVSYVDALVRSGSLNDAERVISQAIAAGLRQDVISVLESYLTIGNEAGGDNPSSIQIDALIKLYNQGACEQLELEAKSLLDAFPSSAVLCNILGGALHYQGKNEEAVRYYNRAIELRPGYAEALSNCSLALRDSRLLESALEYIDESLRIEPINAASCNNRGLILRDLKQYELALDSLEKAIQINPEYAEAIHNRGLVLHDMKKDELAMQSYDLAIQLKPDYAEAYLSRAIIFLEARQLDESLRNLEQSIQFKPDYAEAYHYRGLILQEMAKYEEALASYEKAIELKPVYAEAYNNRGMILREFRMMSEAINSYRKAIEFKPDYACVYFNYAEVLQTIGKPDEAAHNYRQAAQLDPVYRLTPDMVLPIICRSVSEITRWRKQYSLGIENIKSEKNTLSGLDNLNYGFFYLAYHGRNNRSILQRFTDNLRLAFEGLSHEATYLSGWSLRNTGKRRIRIGFVSEFLIGHTIGYLFQGYIKHLDRERFEVIVIHSSKTKNNDYRDYIDGLADRVINLPSDLTRARQLVEDESLDVLIYPDIGMSRQTYFLAYSRLARVQAVCWGHPDTTGLNTMDYFISADCIEPEDYAENYTEHLVRMNRLPCYYEHKNNSPDVLERTELGLPETGTLYGCPQSLFKIHPDFDSILAEIVTSDSDATIVMIEGLVHPDWTELLKKRWSDTNPALLDRVLFLPRMPADSFMSLMSHFDVILDPIHFGSGNTMYEAVAYGIPIVTWPGQFMRGRIVAGAYRQMRVDDAPIAEDLKDYASLAVALANDRERRSRLVKDTLDKADQLFSDIQAVRELESFIEEALQAAGRGEKLPNGWSPPN